MTMAQQDLFVDSKVELITPQQAALWLEGANLHNRPLNMPRAKALSLAIQRGEWSLNGDAIRFCTNGQLLDGQHRLQAIVLAGQSVNTLVVRGLAPNSFATIDTNRAVRTAYDVLSLSGIPHYAIVAPAARLLFYWQNYGNPYDLIREHAPTAEQVLEYSQTPGLGQLAPLALTSKWCRKYLGSGMALFCMFVFSQYREEHARTFFHKLETGIGLEEGSPILLLRERLTVQSTTERLRPVAKAAYVFKAWRLYLLGANARQLKLVFTPSVPMRDHFKMERNDEGRYLEEKREAHARRGKTD